jgi:hypothetical protein
MTSQAITGGLYGKAGGRSYTAASTDGIFTNAATTEVGSAQLGEAQKNTTIDHVCLTYTAGAAAWRIVNRVTQQIQRQGFCFMKNQAVPSESAITPYTVQLDDILQIFSVAVPT